MARMHHQERAKRPEPRKRLQFWQWAYLNPECPTLSPSPPLPLESHFLGFSGVLAISFRRGPKSEEPGRTCTENKASDYELNVTDLNLVPRPIGCIFRDLVRAGAARALFAPMRMH